MKVLDLQHMKDMIDQIEDDKKCLPWDRQCYSDLRPIVYSTGKALNGRRAALEYHLGRSLKHVHKAALTCGDPMCINPNHIVEVRIT